jgi:hypothetical protein
MRYFLEFDFNEASTCHKKSIICTRFIIFIFTCADFYNRLLPLMISSLTPENPEKFHAEFYKIIKYQPEGFFLPHVDAVHKKGFVDSGGCLLVFFCS